MNPDPYPDPMNPDPYPDPGPAFQVIPDSDTDPDPTRIQGFDNQKLRGKNTTEHFFKILF